MKLHSPAFEKALRRDVKKAVKSSRELKREFRAANRFRKQYQAMLLLRPGISLGFALFVWRILESTGHVASALAVINLWALLFVFIQAQRLLTCLYGSADLLALMLLPVTETTIFRWERQKFFRGSLWLLLDLLGSFTALALASELPVAKWIAVVPIPFVVWLEVLALAALAAAYLPRVPYPWISSGVIGLLFVSFMARDLVGAVVIGLIDRCAPSLNLLAPTGWAASVFQAVLPDHSWVFLFLLLPVAGIIWTLSSSFQRLAAAYKFQEPLQPEAPDLVPGEEVPPGPAEFDSASRRPRVGPTEIEDIVQSRQFLLEPDWQHHGALESLLWHWFNARERAVVEFVFPDGLSLAKPWRKILRNLTLTGVAAALAGVVGPTAQFWVLGGGLFVTVCQVLAQVLANGRAFQQVNCSGVNIPLYAGYGIGFRELAGVLFKLSAVQMPLVLLFGTAGGILVCWLLNLPFAAGALMGLKAAGLLLASRFLLVTFAFSSGTDDTSRFRLRSILLLLLAVVFCLGFAGLGAGGLFVPQQPIAWLLWALAPLEAYGFFRLYGWFYHANRFDLMSLSKG